MDEGTVKGEPENHAFAGGKCTVCEYECQHGQQTAGTAQQGELLRYETTAEQHTPVYRNTTPYTCEVCGETVKTEEGTVKGTAEAHKFENGMCSVCEYNCQHTEVTPGVPELIEGEDRYETTSTQHTRVHKINTPYICSACGVTVRWERGEERGETEDHTFLDGVCYQCRYTCQHDQATAGETVRGDLDHYETTATQHTPVYETQTLYTCDVCKTGWTQTGTEKGEPADHAFVDGKCTVCGHECEHTDADVSVESEVKEYINMTDMMHTAVNTVTTTTTCKYCGDVSVLSKDENGEPEEHTYVDGVCTVCKHECEHTDAEVSVDSKVKEYINKTDETHTAVNTVTTTTTCKYCDYVSESSKDVNGEPEVHIYVDGKCTVCEYECTHSKETAGEPVQGEVIEYTSDDAQHTPIYETETTYTCDTCGKTRINKGEQPGQGEAHIYEDGVCTVCEYECRHDAATDTFADTFDAFTEIERDDEMHTAAGTRVTTTTCDTCGMETNVTEAPVKERQPHIYADGVCTLCGHECAHSKPESANVFVAASYQSNGEAGHTAMGDIHEITNCTCCGLQVNDVIVEEGVTQVGAHSFSGRTCRLCGYARPESEEDEDVVVDEPIFTELGADEVLHGVAAGDAARMATAMATVSESIHEQYGDDVTVSVVYSDEVLTAEELEALSALEPAEQMFVLLSVLGYENEVNHTLETWERKISDAATALIETVRARIEAMNEEERAAYEALLEDCFPLRTATFDGEECDYVEITLEIRIRLVDGYRLERYGFCESEGTWLLTRISVAGVDG